MVKKNSLKLSNVSFYYKKNIDVLKNINVNFHEGNIIALLGINGSGKTTLFKILTGIYEPKNGNLLYNDEKIDKHNIIKYKSNLGFMPEFVHLYKDMYVREVLSLLANLKGYKNFNMDKILRNIQLYEHAHKKVKALSKGMKQRLNLGQAIIGKPKIVIFDEPSNGFDCTSITMFYKTLKELSDNGSIVIISSHHLTEIYGNVDKVLILSSGMILKSIDINALDEGDKNIYLYINKEIEMSLKVSIIKKFGNIVIKNNLITGILSTYNILELVKYIASFGLIVKDIRVESRILEDVLINLS